MVADATDVTTALLILPAFTMLAAVLAWSLPREGTEAGAVELAPTPTPARFN